MNSGNWATDIEGGAKFGYSLLGVVFLSNAIALLQSLYVRLGLGKTSPKPAERNLASPLCWVFAELAIIACDSYR